MITPIYRFKGGISPDQDTPESLRTSICDQPLVEILAIPLLEYWGDHGKPVVKPGDKVLRGQLIASHNHPLGVPRHAPTSGRVTDILDQHLAHPSGLSGPSIVMAADGDDCYSATDSAENYQTLDAQQLLQKIYAGGVTGMGGGGYPVHAKLAAALNNQISLLIINALECEPLISCDEALINACSDDIVIGINILMRLLQPARCVIAVKEDMSSAMGQLTQSVERLAETPVEIVNLPNIYPIGSEKLLIYSLTGVRLNSDCIPAANGMVCQNVGTVKAIFDAVIHGQPVTSRIITVAGDNVAQPTNLRTRLGTPVNVLLDTCAEQNRTHRVISLGGPLNGYPLAHDDAAVDAHHNCILSNPIQPASELTVQPCIKCGFCAEVCPVQLLPQRLLWHTQARQLEQLVKLNISECLECGACDTVCPSGLPLTASFRYARDQVGLDLQQRDQSNAIQHRFEKHQQRITALQQAKQQRLQETSLQRDRKTNASIVQAALERTRKKQRKNEEQS